MSWLGAWALLLGFRDFKTQKQMDLGLPCLRPEEADMLEVVQLWARIASAAEVRERVAWASACLLHACKKGVPPGAWLADTLTRSLTPPHCGCR